MNDLKQSTTLSLRERAELKWAEIPTPEENHSAETMQRLVQELQIHQIELEMQNEELRQSQQELSESRDRYADLYDFAPVAYLTLDKHGNITAANLTAAAMLGVSKVELLKANISRFIDSESQDTMYFHLQRVYAGDNKTQKEHCELVIAQPSGEKITVYAESLRYDSKNTAFCRTVLLDITQQKIQADALEASEKRYHRISNAVNDYIYHVPFGDNGRGKLIPDTDGEMITGYSADELVAMDNPARALIHPEDWPAAKDQRQKLIKDVDISTEEVRIITKEGDIRWMSNTLSALRDQSGKLIGYDGMLQDITHRKVAQLTLEAINTTLTNSLDNRTLELQETVATVKLMATAMTNLLEGVVIVQRDEKTDDYRTVFANKSMARMSGYTTEQLAGKTLSELEAENIVPANVTGSTAVAKGAGRYLQAASLRLPTGHKSYLDAEILTSPIYDVDNQVSHLVLIYRDVTARKTADRQLFERDAHLKSILNTVADAIFTIDKKGTISDVNPVTYNIFGYTSEELKGGNIATLLPTAVAGTGNIFSPFHDYTYREYTAQRKNGSSIPIGLSIREIDHSGLFTYVVRDLSLVKSMQRQMLDITEEENRRIGRELHDSIQQQLVGIRLLADNLLAGAQGLPQTVFQAQTRLTKELDHTIDELRTLCRGMVAMHLDGDGLRAALNQLATGVTAGRHIHCSFDSIGKIILTNSAVSVHIYRIAQETVTNALKHAKATHITLTLRVEMGQLTLEICDNGVGICDEALESDSMGLQIMRYRADLIDANLKIYRRETGGTCVSCSVPMSSHLSKHRQEKHLGEKHQ